MSSVRMCDGCGNIFPEGQAGSATGQVTVMEENRNGEVRPITKVQDTCARCVAGAKSRAYANATPAIDSTPSDTVDRSDTLVGNTPITRDLRTK